MPKGFKMPSETPKYDGLQEPKTWLEDYRIAVKCNGGSRTTAMQCLQLQLKVSARVWLKGLPAKSISSWEDLVHRFTSNFQSTYKRPASIEELRACKQKSSESIRSYIGRWTTLKNDTEGVSEERAIDAFNSGLRRQELKEELGHTRPATIAHLMDIANQWVDGEDSLHNDRARSLDDDDADARHPADAGRRRDRNGDRRRKRKDRSSRMPMALSSSWPYLPASATARTASAETATADRTSNYRNNRDHDAGDYRK